MPCNGRAICRSNPPGSGGVSVVGVELTATYKVTDEVLPIADAAPDPRAEERALVARAQAGDLEAFEVLYRANLGRVYALCYRMAGDASLAEELAQDVFVRAWQRLGSFRGESAFSSWLHPLTVNVALSERGHGAAHVA